MDSYDSNGNTLTKVVGSNTTSYAWDFENRLSSVTLPGTGGTVSFKYDPFGRRIYKSSSNGTSIFAYGEFYGWSGWSKIQSPGSRRFASSKSSGWIKCCF